MSTAGALQYLLWLYQQQFSQHLHWLAHASLPKLASHLYCNDRQALCDNLEGHPPYRSGSARTSAFPGSPVRAVLVPHWGSRPHCRTREIRLDSQAMKWSTRPKPSGTSSSLFLCLHYAVSLEKPQNVPSRRLKRHRRDAASDEFRLFVSSSFQDFMCTKSRRRISFSKARLMITNKVDELGGKAKSGSVRIRAWTRLENNQETSWHLRRTVSHPTSQHSQKPFQKHSTTDFGEFIIIIIFETQ